MENYHNSMYHANNVELNNSKSGRPSAVHIGLFITLAVALCLGVYYGTRGKSDQGAGARDVTDDPSRATVVSDNDNESFTSFLSIPPEKAEVDPPVNAMPEMTPEEHAAAGHTVPKPLGSAQDAMAAGIGGSGLKDAYGSSFIGATDGGADAGSKGTAVSAPLMATFPESKQTMSSMSADSADLIAAQPPSNAQGQRTPAPADVERCKQSYCGKIKNDVRKKMCESRCAVNPRFVSGIEVTKYRNNTDYLRPALQGRKYMEHDAGDRASGNFDIE